MSVDPSSSFDPAAQLKELAQHLQTIREDERSHLARELHDELGALLTAAKLDVARLKSRLGSTVTADATERLAHLNEPLNGGIALKRRIIEDLRPSSLSNLGLVAALEIQLREFGARSEITVVDELEHVELAPAAQLTVYRLVQDALTNTVKYPTATAVPAQRTPVEGGAARRGRPASGLHGARLLGLIGCNDVSRHDAVVGVRAGFCDGEISALWPASGAWSLHEGARGLFSHVFTARRPAS